MNDDRTGSTSNTTNDGRQLRAINTLTMSVSISAIKLDIISLIRFIASYKYSIYIAAVFFIHKMSS